MIPYIHAELSAKRYGGIPEDFYEDLFGDHVQVTVSSDGKVNAEGYSHD